MRIRAELERCPPGMVYLFAGVHFLPFAPLMNSVAGMVLRSNRRLGRTAT